MKPGNQYVPHLDGLRSCAILLVLLGHFNLLNIYFARFGVTVFFFVSGFLITKLLIYEHNKQGSISLQNFYLRRAFRLYPALLLMIAITCFFLLLSGYNLVWNDVFAGLFYYTNYNIAFFQHPLPADPQYFNILWSLSVEEHFYLIYPVLFLLFSKRKKQFLYFLGCLLFLFLLIRLFTVNLLDSDHYFKYNYFPTHSRADSILYGCVSALLIYQFNAKWYLNILNYKVPFYLGMILLGVSFIYTSNIFFQTTFAYSLFGIGLCLCIPSFDFAFRQTILKKLLCHKIMVFIGRLSYSLYLFHWVALKIANNFFLNNTFNWYLMVIPLTITLSLASYYAIEIPCLSLRKKYGSNAINEIKTIKAGTEPAFIVH